MSDALADYKELREEAQSLIRQQERLAGRKDEILSTLQKDFGVNSLKKARRRLEEKEERKEDKEQQLEKVLDKLRALIKKCRGKDE